PLGAGKAEAVERWRARLGAALPDYMVPAVIMVLDTFPVTSHGKVDRRALPAPDAADLARSAYVAPRNDVEAQLCAIWQHVLALPRVGVQDNFFSLGGDSIVSIRVVSQARERGMSFSVKDLFRHQTVAELARELAQSGGLGPRAAAIEPFA